MFYAFCDGTEIIIRNIAGNGPRSLPFRSKNQKLTVKYQFDTKRKPPDTLTQGNMRATQT